MKAGYFALGVIFVLTALVGLAIPIFPSSPFFLLAIACFMKASDRLAKKIRRNRLYRKFVMKRNNKPTGKYIAVGIFVCIVIAAATAVLILCLTLNN